MKKLINGKQINIPIEFFSDFLLGQELKKITLSNIYDIKNIPFSNDIILKYKDLFNSLHPIMQIIESNLKYCVIGELLHLPYYVKNLTLEIDLKNGYSIYFKGENWSYGTSQKTGKKLNDFQENSDFTIYTNYLKYGKTTWFKNSFPELWEALDENEDKLETVLPDICSFISINEIKINKNEIYDLDLKVKYTVIPEFVINSPNAKTVLVLDNKKSLKKTKDTSSYNFKVFKQFLIENANGKKDYGSLAKIDDFYPEVWKKLNDIEKTSLKGIILNKTLYFEIDNDIYRVLNNKVDKLIQGANLYGYKMKLLLFYHDTRYSESIVKRVIYILKDNSYDIAKIEFLTETNND